MKHKTGLLAFVFLGMLFLGLSVLPVAWAMPGSDAVRYTIPTRTPTSAPPTQEPPTQPPTQPPPTQPPGSTATPGGGEPTVPVATATSTPTGGTATPVEVTGTPVQVTGTPAAGTGTPVTGTGTPMAGMGTPVQVTGTPVQVTGTPGDGESGVEEAGEPAAMHTPEPSTAGEPLPATPDGADSEPREEDARSALGPGTWLFFGGLGLLVVGAVILWLSRRHG